MANKWITWGKVRGFGAVRKTEKEATLDQAHDVHMCARLGGKSDRAVWWIDDEGYLRDESGGYAYREPKNFQMYYGVPIPIGGDARDGAVKAP